MNADTLLLRYGTIYLTRLRKHPETDQGTGRNIEVVKRGRNPRHHATYIRKGACYCLIIPSTVILHLLLCASDISLIDFPERRCFPRPTRYISIVERSIMTRD
jgi:hypothetical protein